MIFVGPSAVPTGVSSLRSARFPLGRRVINIFGALRFVVPCPLSLARVPTLYFDHPASLQARREEAGCTRSEIDSYHALRIK